MRRISISKWGVVLGLLALKAGSCAASTMFVNTIGTFTGTDPQYQIGAALTRTAQLGWDKYPASGDFTAVRPTFDIGNVNGTCAYGTSGVPLPDGQDSKAAWIVQPFTPAESGYVTNVQFVAQRMPGVGYYYGPQGTTAYASIIDAPVDGLLPTIPAMQPVDLSSARLGAIVGTGGLARSISAGTTYWLVMAPTDTVGAWTSTGLDYVNLNWTARSVIPDASKVSDALYNNDNGSGGFVALPGRAIRIRIIGWPTAPEEVSVGDAKARGNGAPVKVASAVITANTGAVGPDFFYIEDEDRPSGIRVIGRTGEPVGQHVTVTGEMTTLPGGEKAIDTTTGGIEPEPTNNQLDPLAMNLKSLHGFGLSAVGLLARVTGTVQTLSPLVINDGSVSVQVIGTVVPSPVTGEPLSVTGIVSLNSGGAPVLLVP